MTFACKDDTQGVTHYGLIAEQVATVYPELVTRTAMGEVQTVKYHALIPMLLNELQRQRQEFQRGGQLIEQPGLQVDLMPVVAGQALSSWAASEPGRRGRSCS